MTLHFKLPYSLKIDEKKYDIMPYFDRVLKVIELQKEDELTEIDKIEVCLSLLFKEPEKIEKKDRLKALKAVLSLLIETPKQTENEKNSGPYFDFVQDAGLIYAAFLTEFGIDLFKEQGRLHWFCFVELFKALTDRTKLVEVMQIRQKPYPKPTKNNQEERLKLAKLKSFYALKQNEKDINAKKAKDLEKLANNLMKVL